MKSLSVTQPIITTWTWHANLLSILGKHPEVKPWIFSNYIQIRSTTQHNQELFFDFWPGYNIILECPFTYNQVIKRETIDKLFNASIVDFLTNSIDMNNYIYGIFDEKFIGACKAFNRKKYPHELFIFGYDKNLQLFDIADFTFKNSNSKYTYAKASFKEIEASYKSITESDDYLYNGRGGLHLISYFSNATYSFDTELVVDSIKDYISSSVTARHHSNKENPADFIYGVNSYESIKQHLNLLVEGRVKSNNRPFQFLVDHKTMMLQRIEFMGKMGILYNYKVIYEQYCCIKNEFILIRNQYLKADMKNELTSFLKILQKIDPLVEKEVETLRTLLNNIISSSSPNISASDWITRTGNNRMHKD